MKKTGKVKKKSQVKEKETEKTDYRFPFIRSRSQVYKHVGQNSLSPTTKKGKKIE